MAFLSDVLSAQEIFGLTEFQKSNALLAKLENIKEVTYVKKIIKT